MYIIHFIKSGAGTAEINGHKYKLRKNDAFIVRPNTLTVQTADNSDPWELYFFAFGGSFAAELVEKTVFRQNTFSVATAEFSIFHTISDVSSCDFSSLSDVIADSSIELNETSFSEIHNLEILFKLISYFDIKHTFNLISDESAPRHNQQYISLIQEYIQLNYSKPIKISDIAKLLNISRSHLYRIFKEGTGISLEEYLVSVRINMSRTLLGDTNFPISSISSLVGYSHCPTFFRIFKQRTGLTPNQYRANIKNKYLQNKKP